MFNSFEAERTNNTNNYDSPSYTLPTMATNTVAKTNASNMAVDQRVQPNQSLYIQNLPEKLQKPDLKRSLYMLFSTFGPVLDVTAVKSSKMRGQAHVLFRDVHAATQAMRACQGFEFYGREMVSRTNTSMYGRRNHILTETYRKSATRKRRATPSRK
jgi:RNA recognition motif-containing protein